MDIGIMVPFFTEISMKRRLELIKEAGFTTFMLSLDPAHEKFTASLGKIVDHCNKIGLKIVCGHAPYKDPDVNDFWLEGEAGDLIEKEFTKVLYTAHEYGVSTVVYHLHFENEVSVSMSGIERLKRMVAIAERLNVNIAVENLYKYDELGYIFDHIKSDNLGMCYDCGHENFLTPNADFIFKYGDRLMSTHIHDNNGLQDQHKTPFTGSIDWENIAKGLANANNVSLEAEVRIYRPEGKDKITEEELLELLKKEYSAMKRLATMVEANKERELVK
ncbi:TPA: sugar phosphate isomerase/epimerase [bacterium]|nr:sugar phosphate isomerase/epimerase [bacterium]